VFAIAGPERSLVLDRRRSDKSIGDFKAMATHIFVKQTASQSSGFIIGGQTDKQFKERSNDSMFLRPRACPDFRDYDRCTENRLPGGDQLRPLGDNLWIAFAQYLNGDIGIQENIHRMPSRFRRVPLRRLRTYFSVSGRSVRSLHRPTMPINAARRSSVLSK